MTAGASSNGDKVDANLHFKNHALNAVDSKGRVSVPASFRSKLAARGALISGDNNLNIGLDGSGDFLLAHDDAAHHELHARVRERISELPAEQRIAALEAAERDLFGAPDLCKFDGNGRMVMSPMLRNLGKFDKLAFFVGTGLTFQIWAPEIALKKLPEGSPIHRTLVYLLENRGAE